MYINVNENMTFRDQSGFFAENRFQNELTRHLFSFMTKRTNKVHKT